MSSQLSAHSHIAQFREATDPVLLDLAGSQIGRTVANGFAGGNLHLEDGYSLNINETFKRGPDKRGDGSVWGDRPAKSGMTSPMSVLNDSGATTFRLSLIGHGQSVPQEMPLFMVLET